MKAFSLATYLVATASLGGLAFGQDGQVDGEPRQVQIMIPDDLFATLPTAEREQIERFLDFSFGGAVSVPFVGGAQIGGGISLGRSLDFRLQGGDAQPDADSSQDTARSINADITSDQATDVTRGFFCEAACDIAAAAAATACTTISLAVGVAACLVAADIAREECRKSC